MPRTLIQEVPTFHPSPAEFQDPLQYIASIRPHAERFGLARIVPPAGFHPPFAISKENFRFKTRSQAVHELKEKASVSEGTLLFVEDYSKFLATNKGKSASKVSVAPDLDLSKLWRLVQIRGGYDKVTAANGWRNVSRTLEVLSILNILSLVKTRNALFFEVFLFLCPG